MKYTKQLRTIANSNYIISFNKDERTASNMNVGDFVEIDIKVIKKSYVCNHCNSSFLVDINLIEPTNISNTEIICPICNTSQPLINSILTEEKLNQLTKKKNG